MSIKSKPGILLLHGICSNGTVFRGVKGQGLFQLLSRDFRPFIGELTSGRPPSGKPGWDFDWHLEHDLPRIWKEFRSFAPESGYVLGYSMGGMLALAAQAKGLIHADKMMVLGSPFSFPGVPFYPALMKKVLIVAQATGLKRIPIRLAARFLYFYFTVLLREPPNPNLDIFHSLAYRAGVDVPVETLIQAVHWVESGLFCDRAGKNSHLPFFKNVTVPLLFVAGEQDRIAPPQAVLAGCQAISSPRKFFLTIPNARHIDLVAGPCLEDSFFMARSWFGPEHSRPPVSSEQEPF